MEVQLDKIAETVDCWRNRGQKILCGQMVFGGYNSHNSVLIFFQKIKKKSHKRL